MATNAAKAEYDSEISPIKEKIHEIDKKVNALKVSLKKLAATDEVEICKVKLEIIDFEIMGNGHGNGEFDQCFEE